MKIVTLFLWPVLIPAWCFGQIIDIGGIWEIQCPHVCNCQIAKFYDLPLYRWANMNTNNQEDLEPEVNYYQSLNNDEPMATELLKVATCVLTKDAKQLLESLPIDLQVLTILESGDGDKEIRLSSTDTNRFTDLISLDIQGMGYNDRLRNSGGKLKLTNKRYGIVLDVDALLPLGPTLRYLNLERVRLASKSTFNKGQVNLVVKPVSHASNEHEDQDSGPEGEVVNQNGLRLIFLSHGGDGENGEEEEREILPYNLYKQEVEGYRESAHLFTGLGRLTHLRAYDCALKDISWEMFDGLDSLVLLSLEKNDLKVIPKFCFYGTPILKSLSLAENQLLTLTSVELAGLLALERLDLRRNNLTFLSELSFPPFPVLVEADFTGNPLDYIFPSTFEIMNATTKLYLGGDGTLLKLQQNSFLGLRLLEVLHLFNVEMQVLERFILRGMPALKELKMNGNISSIDFDAFLELRSLEDLDLSNCQIRELSMDAFYGLEKVKRIDLSRNELETIPPGLFTLQQQTELREILLNKNKLTMLPLDFFKSLKNPGKQHQILNLRLDGNPWDCNCDMIYWNPNLVNRVKETAPRCTTPTKLKNWGVFYALRKGGLRCKRIKRRHFRTGHKLSSYEDTNNIS
ncbi:carboxypeptidase N subunit 2 [Neodiprion pinetum]|uniref:Carboxypeptidase N subunit 2-like n=1 Tax=Neodiprion lecontei TaxID=441921 RepID=A0ABM3GC32_NEOLC|nr:carboxypeptidase N subunit 2-like [Neodiprion lecontei]